MNLLTKCSYSVMSSQVEMLFRIEKQSNASFFMSKLVHTVIIFFKAGLNADILSKLRRRNGNACSQNPRYHIRDMAFIFNNVSRKNIILTAMMVLPTLQKIDAMLVFVKCWLNGSQTCSDLFAISNIVSKSSDNPANSITIVIVSGWKGRMRQACLQL